MTISIMYQGQTYQFVSFGGTNAWVNVDNVVVPAALGTILSAQAIDEGFDSELFRKNLKEKVVAKNKGAKITKTKKGSLIGSVPLAKLIADQIEVK